MTLTLESETTIRVSVDLVLLGFRNDLARRRVHEFVSEQNEWTGAVPLPDDLSLPFTLLEGIDADSGKRLAERLRELGALVRLDRPIEPALPQRSTTLTDASPLSTSRAWHVDPFLVRLLVVGGIVAIVGGHLANIAHEKREQVRASARKDAQTIAFRPERNKRMQNRKRRRMRAEIHQLTTRKEFATAIERLDQAAASAPSANGMELETQRQVVYRQWARAELADGRVESAMEIVRKAIAGKETSEMTALQGEIYVLMGNRSAGVTAYEKAVDLGTNDPKVFLSLAGLYRQQGKQRAAVDMLNRAKENGARGKEFDALATVIVREQDAEAGFDSLRSPHFAISFEQGEDFASARLILSYLEDAYSNVGHKLSYYPTEKTPVAIYAAETFQRATHAPGWAGGLYDGRIKVPVRGLKGGDPDLARIMRHEYAHVLIALMSGGHCPAWLNEGIAMWAEQGHDGEHDREALAAIRLVRPPSFRQLERSFVRLSSRRAVAAYAKSYFAVRHIVGRYGELGLQRLLLAFASTAVTDEAFRDALSLEPASLEKDLQHFLSP